MTENFLSRLKFLDSFSESYSNCSESLIYDTETIQLLSWLYQYSFYYFRDSWHKNQFSFFFFRDTKNWSGK